MKLRNAWPLLAMVLSLGLAWCDEQEKKPGLKLEITGPKKGGRVITVTGKAADFPGDTEIRLYVLADVFYLANGTAPLKKDGTWSLSGVIIGRQGQVDVGKKFKLFAVAVPKDKANSVPGAKDPDRMVRETDEGAFRKLLKSHVSQHDENAAISAGAEVVRE